jgi:pyruvate-formate lyase
MAIEIEQLDFTSTGSVGPATTISQFVVQDSVRGLCHGVFESTDYASTEKAKAAALDCQKKHEETPWVSPFAFHSQVLFSGYSGAVKLARLALSLYNGKAWQWDASSVSGLDQKHFEIAVDLLRSYHQYGENDHDFMQICEKLRDRYTSVN